MIFVLAAAVLFYVILAVSFLERLAWSLESPMDYALVLLPCLGTAALAVTAYFAHRTLRQVYLFLNALGVLLGAVWVGLEVLLNVEPQWIILDTLGVGTAIAVCWTFWHSNTARRFLDEQELVVKRV